MATHSSHEAPERDDLLVGDDVLEVLGGPVQGHLLDSIGGLTGVLEKYSVNSRSRAKMFKNSFKYLKLRQKVYRIY